MAAPFTTTITPVFLDTVLGHLTPHFLPTTNGDFPVARHTASHLLAAYNVATEEELGLAGEIVSFGFHALEALSEAAAPDLSMNQKLRLRGSAVSLSREAHKAQRKLDQLQKARLTASVRPEVQAPPLGTPEKLTTSENPGPPENPTTPENPGTAQARGLIELAQEVIDASRRKGGAQAWTLSRQQRRAAEQIAETFKRNKAEQARREARQTPIPVAAANQVSVA